MDRLRELEPGQPPAMQPGPSRPAIVAAMTQQKPGELLARPAQAAHCVEPGPHQIALRFVPSIRNPHRRQLAGPVQLRQTGGIPSIGLDPIACPLGDQRRGDHYALVSPGRQATLDAIPARSRFVAKPQGHAVAAEHRRRVMADRITYVGLDVHKDSIVVAVAAGGLRGEVREYGRIANTPTALDRLLRKLGGDGMTLRFCYEAGPCGYGIQRRLSTGGHECVVVAPSLIPKRAGDRVKTDRRDAASLAKLHRAGELTAVWVPDARHEAMRDLVRARLDAVRSLRRARQQLSGFLLRHGCHYGRPAWTRLHRRWLAGLKFAQRSITSCWKIT